MLEDIGKIKEFSDCIVKAKRTTRFIYAHTRIVDQMRSLNGKIDLVRPGATRFATSLTLASMWQQCQYLKALFVSTKWYASKLKPTEPGRQLKTLLSVPFWNSAENCMRASQPILLALRIVDGDEIPALPEFGQPRMLRRNIEVKHCHRKKPYAPWQLLTKGGISRWSKNYMVLPCFS